MTPKRVCEICKNKGCLSLCRFPKAPPAPARDQIKVSSTTK